MRVQTRKRAPDLAVAAEAPPLENGLPNSF